jgi:hypothetical protein
MVPARKLHMAKQVHAVSLNSADYIVDYGGNSLNYY